VNLQTCFGLVPSADENKDGMIRLIVRVNTEKAKQSFPTGRARGLRNPDDLCPPP